MYVDNRKIKDPYGGFAVAHVRRKDVHPFSDGIIRTNNMTALMITVGAQKSHLQAPLAKSVCRRQCR